MRSMIMVAVMGMALTACSLKVNDKEVGKVGGGGDRTEDSYDYTFNGCPTGRQSFSGTAEEVRKNLCAALQDETRNKGCAQGMRKKHFASKCPGTFTPSSGTYRSSDEVAEELLANTLGLTEEERAEAVNGLTNLLRE